MRLNGKMHMWLKVVICVALAGCVLFSIAYIENLALVDSGGSLNGLPIGLRIAGVMQQASLPTGLLTLLYAAFLVQAGRIPRRSDFPIVLLALLLAVLVVLGASFAQFKTMSFYYANAMRVLAFFFTWGSFSVLLYSVLKPSFDAILEWREKRQLGKEESSVFFADDYGMPWLFKLLPILFFIGWLPYIILAGPGSVSYDMTRMIQQFQGQSPYSTHHPLAMTLLYGAVFSIGKMAGGANGGVLLITIVQTFAWAAVCTFLIKVIRIFKAPRWFVVCSIVFFAVTPIFGTYCQYAVKDSLFGAFFAFYMGFYVLYVKSPQAFTASRCMVVALMLAAFATGVSRNNGFYVVLLSLPFLALLQQGRKSKCVALIPLVVAIALVPIVNGCLQVGLGATSGSAAEALSIPFQQTARYAKMHPDDITEWEYSAINGVLDYEHIADNYRWNVSDPVKDTYKKEGSLSVYFSAWASQALRHPGTYLDATLVQSYGYWYPEAGLTSFGQEGYCYGTSEPTSPYWDRPDDSFGWDQWFPDIVPSISNQTVDRFKAIPFIGFFANDGIYTWALLVELAFFAYARKQGGKMRCALVLLPCFVLLLTCIAGPLCGSVRYALGIMAVFPITAVACFCSRFDGDFFS